MHAVDWLIVLILNGTVIGYGFYLAKGTKSSSEWFLGRRALPWWAIGLSMFATNVDNADIVSVTGKTFTEGLHIITVYAIGSAVGGYLAAFLITPAIYRAGLYTNAEYLEARFGPGTRVLSALIQIQYRSSMLGLMIWSMYLLLTGLNVTGPVQTWLLIILLVICSGIYTAWGGLRSVVWTDALQAIVMMVGALVIFLAVWNAVGGWNGMEQKLTVLGEQKGKPLADLPHIGRYDGGSDTTSPYEVQLGNSRWNLGPWVVILGWTIIASGYWTVNHTQTMRLMGARSIWDMKMAAVAGVLLSLPIMIGSSCLGVFARALPQYQNLSTSDALYPLMANTYLGIGLKGLVVAGLIAAAISTFDSMGSALSAIFTRDVYARLLVRDRDDAHYVRVGRWATVGVLLLGFAYLPFILLQRNMLDAFTTLIPVFVTPLFTIYVIGALAPVHRRSGGLGLLVGSIYGLIALSARESSSISWLPSFEWLPLWMADRWGALCCSFLLTAFTMLVVTLGLGRESRSLTEAMAQSDEGRGQWLQRSREALPPLAEHPFSKPLPWWAAPQLWAAVMMLLCIYVVFGMFW